jgi:hypothetical protein
LLNVFFYKKGTDTPFTVNACPAVPCFPLQTINQRVLGGPR